MNGWIDSLRHVPMNRRSGHSISKREPQLVAKKSGCGRNLRLSSLGKTTAKWYGCCLIWA